MRQYIAGQNRKNKKDWRVYKMSVNNKNRYFFWVTKIIHEKGGRREKSILKNCSMKKVEKNIIQVKNDLGVCYVYIPEFSMDMCHICG